MTKRRFTESECAEIKRALNSLGYKGCRARIEGAGRGMCTVTVRNIPMGLYDFGKHTFVD